MEPCKKAKDNNSIFTIFLTTIMLALSIVVAYSLFFKDDALIQTPTQKIVPLAPDVVLPTDVHVLRETVNRLAAQNKRMADQLWLLGLQGNQNAVMLKLANPENANRVVQLTEDWKLNKKPDSVKIKDTHLPKLNEFIDGTHATSLESAEMPETTYEE